MSTKSIERINARLAEVRQEIERIDADAGDAPLDERTSVVWGELRQEAEELVTQRAHFVQREADRAQLRSYALANPAARLKAVNSDDMDADPLGEPRSSEDRSRRGTSPWDLSSLRNLGMSQEHFGSELRARALTAIERMPGATQARREAATRMVEEFDPIEGPTAGALSRHVLLASDPDYFRAFSKAARGPALSFTEDERRAVERAMSLTDAAGGYLVPFQLDPTLILISDGTANPIRAISRTVVATGDVWNGVSSTNAQWSWDAEAAEVSDDTTTFGQPLVPVYKAAGFIPISIEALADEQNVTTAISDVLAAGKEDLEAAGFTTGSGSGQPTGIVTALTGGSSVVTSTTTDTFAVGDVYKTETALPARHRRRGQWAANKAIYQSIRQFGTSDGHALWERIGNGQPPELLGYPAHEASDMDGTISATVDNLIMVLGDWQNYVIADRLGMTIEFISHLFGSNRRPTGQRGFYAYYRVGADSVNDAAFRMLNVT
ncbi:phage major capsid protein [Frankia sp. Cr1]|uniref:phage major capsid protein n=1 Tax=Frankia sp. Cr1 TaxID=3073931 RepID=UPI002AD23F3C|nr:phage major capsid protein [Frankia sp. Cr1]